MPSPHRVLLLAALMAKFVSRGHGLAITYCSPDNTGADEGFSAVFNQYQSNGACQQTCQFSYAYAVLQGQNCWCSNYAPASQENTYDCNSPCPGYGDEWCGSPSAGLYGYFALNIAPSGTLGGPSSATSTTQYSSSVSATPSTPSSSDPTSSSTTHIRASSSTLISVVSVQSPVQTSSSTIESSSAVFVPVSTAITTSTIAQAQSTTFVQSTTPITTSVYIPPPSSSTTYSTPSQSPSPTSAASVNTEPVTSVITVTGQVRTIVETPSATADPSVGQNALKSSGGISKGTVAGIVVGVAIGLGLIIGLILWFYFKRKHTNSSRGPSPAYGATYGRDQTMDPSRNLPSRQVSQMSSAGLLAGKAPRIQTSGIGASNGPRSADTTSGFSMDRRSVGTDQRLNPHALYAHDEGRQSNISLQDNQDYSRQLRVANPDP